MGRGRPYFGRAPFLLGQVASFDKTLRLTPCNRANLAANTQFITGLRLIKEKRRYLALGGYADPSVILVRDLAYYSLRLHT